VLQVDENEVFQRRGVGQQSLRSDAIEIATVLLKIFFVVGEVRLTFLQKRLGIPQR